jgi:RNA recognition motif-containing protein
LFNGCCTCSVWVARRPPGYAFIDFDDRRDAQDAIRELDGMCRRMIKMYLDGTYIINIIKNKMTYILL